MSMASSSPACARSRSSLKYPILEKSTAFVQFLTRKGVLEDQNIDDEKVRKAKKSTVQKAYHNTEVLLEQYRTIIWVLDCVPGDLAAELRVPTQNIDALVARIDFEMAMENKKLESRLNVTMKTRVLLDRLYDALGVLRKMPGNGEQLYNLIYIPGLLPSDQFLGAASSDGVLPG